MEDVEGEGDCMYLSILQHPSIAKRFPTVLDLRRYLRKWVTRHEKEDVVKKIFEFEKKRLQPWKKRVIRKGVWGSTLEMMLLTCAFRKEIITIGNYKNGRIRSAMKPQVEMITGKKLQFPTSQPLYLYYHKGDFPDEPTDNPNHFAYLMRRDKNETDCESTFETESMRSVEKTTEEANETQLNAPSPLKVQSQKSDESISSNPNEIFEDSKEIVEKEPEIPEDVNIIKEEKKVMTGISDSPKQNILPSEPSEIEKKYSEIQARIRSKFPPVTKKRKIADGKKHQSTKIPRRRNMDKKEVPINSSISFKHRNKKLNQIIARSLSGIPEAYVPPDHLDSIGAPIKKKKKSIHRKRKSRHMPVTKRKRIKQETMRTTNVPSRIFYDLNQSQFESDVSDSSYTRTATLRVRSKESDEELRKSSHKPP